jgi:hypothetical protein
MVTETAVMGDMDIRHYEAIVTDFGSTFSAGFGSAVDGGALPDVDIVADFDIRNFSSELKVLRDGSYDSTRENRTILSHVDVAEDYGVRKNLAAVADDHVVIHVSIRSDFDVVAEYGFRADSCQWTNVIHNSIFFIFQSREPF